MKKKLNGFVSNELKEKQIQVAMDHGDELLTPGWYAEARTFLAGPAKSAKDAEDAIKDFLIEEGRCDPGENIEVYCWQVR